MKLVLATLFIVTLLLTSSSAESTTTASPTAAQGRTPTPSGLGCDRKCKVRCCRSGWRDRCLKYCGICCRKCNGCVPSAPYANKAECPCYRDMKNPKGRDKCP